MVGYATSLYHYVDCLFSITIGYFVNYERHVMWKLLLSQEVKKVRRERTGERHPSQLNPI
jgi:hypothetical protein